MGLPKLRVPRQNPPVGLAPPRANRAWDKATQRIASSWCYPGTHRGEPTSSSFVYDSRPGGFLHAPPCRLASSQLGSPDMDYPGMTRETTRPKFVPRGLQPCLVLWRGTCPCWLSPAYGDPVSTQILTLHHGASLRLLVSLQMRNPHRLGKYPVSSAPLGYCKT
jgi:hypothetical protein